ncbi:hypothetical protein [Oceanobacillus sp. AG]|uniref:hypothetical protein n=1 Tax=Oceanobacillus sp. AG TaxID=2681969 RepID=UPI0012EC5B60|nr:hypothetical protein [Oceanobacillus sp. AG]
MSRRHNDGSSETLIGGGENLSNLFDYVIVRKQTREAWVISAHQTGLFEITGS